MNYPKMEAREKAASPRPWQMGVSTNVEYGPWPCYRLADMRDSEDQQEIQANRGLCEDAPDYSRLLRAAGEALGELLGDCEVMMAHHDACTDCGAGSDVEPEEHTPECNYRIGRDTLSEIAKLEEAS